MRGLATVRAQPTWQSLVDTQLKIANPKWFAVIGTVAKNQVWTQKAAQPGQALILSKPLEPVKLAQASKKGAVNDEHWRVAVDAMRTLNRTAATVGKVFKFLLQ